MVGRNWDGGVMDEGIESEKGLIERKRRTAKGSGGERRKGGETRREETSGKDTEERKR